MFQILDAGRCPMLIKLDNFHTPETREKKYLYAIMQYKSKTLIIIDNMVYK